MPEKQTKEWMTNFLLKSPDFMSELILSNVKLDTLRHWKVEKAGMKSGKTTTAKLSKSVTTKGTSGTDVGSNFPSRRVSLDSSPKTIADLADYIEDPEILKHSHSRRKSLNVLTKMRQEELFLELIIDIAHELSVDALCHKILTNVNMLTGSDRGSVFLVRVNNKGEKYLESKLFDVVDVGSRLSSDTDEVGRSTIIPFGKGLVGWVAQTKQTINVPDAYKDERFNPEIDRRTGYKTKSLLTMPILNHEGAVIGVAQIMNKSGEDGLFTKQDEDLFENFLVFCGISLTNAELFALCINEFKMNQLLLTLTKEIFAEQTNLDSLAKSIMMNIHSLISCERCILYLIQCVLSSDLTSGSPKTASTDVLEREYEVSKAFDMTVADKVVVNPSEQALKEFPAATIALDVASSGETDEYDANLSNSAPMVCENYAIHNMLSVPVFDTNSKVVGVVQMINKHDKEPFNLMDVKTVTMFALYCGRGIFNCRSYENVVKMIARQRVNLDVLSYYATASDTETEELMRVPLMNSRKLKLLSLDFNDATLSDFETCKVIVTIFTELDIIERFKIQRDILCRWLLSVKKNYQPTIYHNWRHAVNVTQMMFYCLIVGKVTTVLSDLEIFTMVVAALCHDLDYRTDTVRRQSPYMLYSYSTVEHHHIDQCIMLFINEKTNIFSLLTADEYKVVLEMLESCILSTDLTSFYKKAKAFQDIASQEKIDWIVEDNRTLLRAMLMVASDVAASCRPLSLHLKSAELVFMEYARQNEEAKSGARMTKNVIQKRIKKELPSLQLGFIDSICLPLYALLGNVFPGLKLMYDACVQNRLHWKKLKEEHE